MVKGIFFTVEEKVWEEFYRILPMSGQRTTFLRAVVYTLLSSKNEPFDLNKDVKEEIKRWKT